MARTSGSVVGGGVGLGMGVFFAGVSETGLLLVAGGCISTEKHPVIINEPSAAQYRGYKFMEHPSGMG